MAAQAQVSRLTDLFEAARAAAESGRGLPPVHLWDPPRCGEIDIRIEETTFSLSDYNRFLAAEKDSIAAFKDKQQAAFNAERERWIANGQADFVGDEASIDDGERAALPPGSEYMTASVPGSVWKVLAKPGDAVKEGETIAILESMKMEIALHASGDGVLTEWLVGEGKPVNAGQNIAVFKRD